MGFFIAKFWWAIILTLAGVGMISYSVDKKNVRKEDDENDLD